MSVSTHSPLPIGAMSPSTLGPLPEYWPRAVSIKHQGIPISTTRIKNCAKNEPGEYSKQLEIMDRLDMFMNECGRGENKLRQMYRRVEKK